MQLEDEGPEACLQESGLHLLGTEEFLRAAVFSSPPLSKGDKF